MGMWLVVGILSEFIAATGVTPALFCGRCLAVPVPPHLAWPTFLEQGRGDAAGDGEGLRRRQLQLAEDGEGHRGFRALHEALQRLHGRGGKGLVAGKR